MSPQQYDAAQQQLLTRQRCLHEHRTDLAIVRAEADREIARLEHGIAEDQHQIEDLTITITAYWRDHAALPEVRV